MQIVKSQCLLQAFLYQWCLQLIKSLAFTKHRIQTNASVGFQNAVFFSKTDNQQFLLHFLLNYAFESVYTESRIHLNAFHIFLPIPVGGSSQLWRLLTVRRLKSTQCYIEFGAMMYLVTIPGSFYMISTSQKKLYVVVFGLNLVHHTRQQVKKTSNDIAAFFNTSGGSW